MFEKLINLFKEEVPQDVADLLTSIEKSERDDIIRTFKDGYSDEYTLGEITAGIVEVDAVEVGSTRDRYYLYTTDPWPGKPVEFKCSRSMKKKVYNALKTKSY